MSTKNNALSLVALAALGLTVTAGKEAIAETLLDNYTVKSVGIAQVNAAGACVVVCTVNSGVALEVDSVRVVGNASGDVKLFSDLSATASLVKRAKFENAATPVTVKRMIVAGAVGNPIAKLKSQYIAFKKERDSSALTMAAINAQETAAEAVGWDTAVGTPENEVYLDYGKRLITVTEVNTYAIAKVATLAAALTAAGIDPLTVV